VTVLYSNQGNCLQIVPGISIGLDYVFPPEVVGFRDCIRVGQNDALDPEISEVTIVQPSASKIVEYEFDLPMERLIKNWEKSTNRKIVGYIWYAVVDQSGAKHTTKQSLGYEKVHSGLRFGFPRYQTFDLSPKFSLLRSHERRVRQSERDAMKVEKEVSAWHETKKPNKAAHTNPLPAPSLNLNDTTTLDPESEVRPR
jgi:hypothetical protein